MVTNGAVAACHAGKGREGIQTATPRSVREVNRAIVLDLIRRHQPVSRAELASRTGIHRSNMSAIVDELLRERLVSQKLGRPNGRGPVPYLLSLEDSTQVLGVNIRHFQTRVALGGLDGRIGQPIEFPTPKNPKAFVARLIEATEAITGRPRNGCRKSIREIGVSFPGWVDPHDGCILWADHFPEYANFPLRARLKDELKLHTSIGNNADLAALAELWLGKKPFSGASSFVFLHVGDVGLGLGIVIKGELYLGHDLKFAGEAGHLVVDPKGPRCRCGRRGCWRLYVSDRATWRRYKPGSKFQPSFMEQLVQMARQGNRKAMQAIEETARYLAVGALDLIYIFNPELIVLGGRIASAWDLIIPSFSKIPLPSRTKVSIVPASADEDHLFLQGAVCLALNRIFSRPQFGPSV